MQQKHDESFEYAVAKSCALSLLRDKIIPNDLICLITIKDFCSFDGFWLSLSQRGLHTE